VSVHSGIARRSEISRRGRSVPRCSRRRFHGNPWRQSLASSACGLFPSTCRSMAKTFVSAVKPGRQAFRFCQPGFLVCAPARQFGWAYLYIDNGGLFLRSGAGSTTAPWPGPQRSNYFGSASCQSAAMVWRGVIPRTVLANRLKMPFSILVPCACNCHGRSSGDAL
jgi:hypothetical protein